MGVAMKKSWQTRRLGDVVEVQNGYAFDSKEFNSSKGMPLIRIRSLKAGTETETRFSGDYDKKYVVKAGDLLIGMDGEFGCYEWKGSPALLNQRVCRLQGFDSQLVPRFLFYGVNSHLKEIEDVTGFTTVKHLSSKQILGIEFSLPPLPEQQRIVGILDEAFDGLATAKANAEKNLQNARALFESHLQSVFTQRGKGWVEKRLDDVCTFSSGGTPSKHRSSYWSGKIPWISGRDMKSSRLSDSLLHISKLAVDESSTRMAAAGTLLILVRGMGLAHGAQIAELIVPCAFNQDIRGIHPEPCLIPQYLLFALRDRINSSNTVLSNAAHGTLKIDSSELHSVMIPVPPCEQQQKIAKTIDSLQEEIQRLESIYQQKLVALEALKKSLLHQAFTGAL